MHAHIWKLWDVCAGFVGSRLRIAAASGLTPQISNTSFMLIAKMNRQQQQLPGFACTASDFTRMASYSPLFRTAAVRGQRLEGKGLSGMRRRPSLPCVAILFSAREPALVRLGAVSQLMLSHSVITCCFWGKCFITLIRKFCLRDVDFHFTLKRAAINITAKKGILS